MFEGRKKQKKKVERLTPLILSYLVSLFMPSPPLLPLNSWMDGPTHRPYPHANL